jgi:PAS domain S-box-containing protein
MRSAKGTPQAAGPSEAVISASDYYWIAVSSAPIGWYESSQHDGIALRYGLLCLVSMLAVTLGSWMIALRQGRLNVANARLEHKRLQAEIITRFQQTYIDEPEPAVLFDKLLQDIIALTGSEFGLIGDVLQDEEGRDYLKCYAFSNIAWNDDTRRFHEENKAAGFVFKNLDNLFGHVITDRVPVIANDPTHDPRRGGNPAGHPEIRAFLGVPVWYGDRLVGEIGLANRPGGYDQALLDQIQPIVEACGRIIIARWDREARHAAEQAATAARRESGAVKQRIDLLLESVGEGVCGVDLDGNIIFINPAARELLGWAEDEGVGLQLHKLTHHHHADGSEFPRTECPVYQTKLDGKPRSVAEDWYWRKDGSGFPVEYTVAAIWQEGKVVGAVNVFRDITQRKQSEQELEAYRTHLESLVKARTVELKVAKEAAEAANVAKSAFLANISHEMRTPLHQVYGMAQLIKREPLSPKQSDRITKLETASLKLTAIIDTILELTKIEAEQFDLVEELFSLEGLLDDVISIAQAKATSKQLQLISEMANVPAKLVGDATHIKKALLNYVTNAIRFTEAGKVTIRVKLAAEIGENVLIRFEVEDTGQGIAPQDLPRLFSIFEQVDNSSTRIFGGLGVGLAMTMKIAQIMGGDAGCDSKLDEGSTFWFTVRLKKG